jgi:hypothetical protein
MSGAPVDRMVKPGAAESPESCVFPLPPRIALVSGRVSDPLVSASGVDARSGKIRTWVAVLDALLQFVPSNIPVHA